MISGREDRMITREVINQAIDYILQHAEEELTLDEVAEHCHFSKFYFSRLFKECVPAEGREGAPDYRDQRRLWVQFLELQLGIPAALPHGAC